MAAWFFFVNSNLASCLYHSTIHDGMISQPPPLIFFASPLLCSLPKATRVSQVAFAVLPTTAHLSSLAQ